MAVKMQTDDSKTSAAPAAVAETEYWAVVGGPPRNYVRPGAVCAETDRRELIECQEGDLPHVKFLSCATALDAFSLDVDVRARVTKVQLYAPDVDASVGYLLQAFPWARNALLDVVMRKLPYDDWFEVRLDGSHDTLC